MSKNVRDFLIYAPIVYIGSPAAIYIGSWMGDQFLKPWGGVGAGALIAGSIYGAFLIWLYSAAIFRKVIIAFIISSPIVYLSLVIEQGILVLFHAAFQPSGRDFFLECVPFVLIVSYVGAVSLIKAEKLHIEQREDFLLALSIRLPYTVTIASLILVLNTRSGHLFLGSTLGVLSAISTGWYVLFVEKDFPDGLLGLPVIWLLIAPVLLLLSVTIGDTSHLLDNLFIGLRLSISAAVGYSLTFLVAYGLTTLTNRLYKASRSMVELRLNSTISHSLDRLRCWFKANRRGSTPI